MAHLFAGLMQVSLLKKNIVHTINAQKCIVSIAVIAIVSCACGGAVYYAISQYLYLYFRTAFHSTTAQIFHSIDIGLRNNFLAMQATSKVVGIHCSTISNWPNCR